MICGYKTKGIYPVKPKFEECFNLDLAVQNGPSFGKSIVSSTEFCAHISTSANRIQFIELCSKKKKNVYASDAIITDMAFATTSNDTLITASRDRTVKVWKLNSDADYIADAYHQMQFNDSVETLSFHPFVKDVIAASVGSSVILYNFENQKVFIENNEICKFIQSTSWAEAGYNMAISGKDCKVHIFDIRSNCMQMEAPSHQNIRDSRVLWLNHNHILTTGFDKNSTREIHLRDIRCFEKVVYTEIFDTAVSILLPLYNRKIDLLLLGKKGDYSIQHIGVGSTKLDFFSKYEGHQIKDFCFAPNECLNYDNVARIWQLSQHSVVPVNYVVPKNSRYTRPKNIETHFVECDKWLNESMKNTCTDADFIVESQTSNAINKPAHSNDQNVLNQQSTTDFDTPVTSQPSASNTKAAFMFGEPRHALNICTATSAKNASVALSPGKQGVDTNALENMQKSNVLTSKIMTPLHAIRNDNRLICSSMKQPNTCTASVVLSTSSGLQQNDESEIFHENSSIHKKQSRSSPQTQLAIMQRISKIGDGERCLNKDVYNTDNNSNKTNIAHNEKPLPNWIVVKKAVLTLPDSHSGVIRFIGQTSFSPGTWIGIELDTPVGENDGTVQNIQYFKCKLYHGIFVRGDKIIQNNQCKTLDSSEAVKLVHETSISSAPSPKLQTVRNFSPQSHKLLPPGQTLTKPKRNNTASTLQAKPVKKHTTKQTQTTVHKDLICCGKTFTRNSSLKRHAIREHAASNERIKCTQCQKSFSHRDNYLQHRKYHTKKIGVKQIVKKHFICEHCTTKFSRKSSILRHLLGKRCSFA